MWNEIRKEFEAIAKRKYDDNPTKNRKMQEKILEENLRFLIAGLLEAHGSDTKAFTSYNAPTSAFNKINTWGIYFSELVDASANNNSVLGGDHKELFQKFTRQILEVENGGANYAKRAKTLPTGGYEILPDSGS